MATTPSPLLPLLPAPRPAWSLSSVEPYVVCHHSHSPAGLSCWHCGQCGGALQQRLQFLGLPVGSSPAPGSCRKALVLLTGCSSKGSQVAEWLQRLGLPAVFEEPQRDEWTGEFNEAEVERWRRRVETGTDEEGRPALHIVRQLPQQVAPVPVVVLLHHDQEDTHPAHQTQQRRDSRLWSHSVFWKQAASVCLEHLVVLATTPSPLLALLKPPADTPPSQQ